MSDTNEQASLPTAVLKPERRPSAAWLVPVAAAVLAGWLGYGAWSERAAVITVQLDQGHGLMPGDEVRYRGIVVGQVRSVELTGGMDGVVVTAALHAQAVDLARAGTRIWVVRPRVNYSGVAGLETLIGPRYLAMLPGEGRPQRSFMGLADAPIVESVDPGDLEIILEAPRRGSVRPGSRVMYRQVPVGVVLSVGLTSDGGAVEARLHIHKAYAQLIRPETRFWNAGGLAAQLGLGGVSLELDSIESLLAGGVAMATPPAAGEVVRTGHRFQLEAEPKHEWLEWEPLVAIGSSLLPPGTIMPVPLRAVIGWKSGRWIKSDEARRGWVLQTTEGLLGPLDLLQVDDESERESAVLEVAGQTVPLTTAPTWTGGRLALLDAQVEESRRAPVARRTATEPEDCLAIGDPTAAPLPLAASRLTPDRDTWLIDPAIAVDVTWHGAAVLARNDGSMVGMIVVAEEAARVVMVPAQR